MRAQGLVNLVVRGVLRTPGLSRIIGSRLVTLYVVGRRSGRRYTVPVSYLAQGNDLLTGTSSGWTRNQLLNRLSERITLSTGMLVAAIGTGWFCIITPESSIYAVLIPASVVTGAGIGIVATSIGSAASTARKQASGPRC